MGERGRVVIAGDAACRIVDGRVAWTGRAREARRDEDDVREFPHATLHGAFTDHHTHLAWFGLSASALSLRGARDGAEAMDRLERWLPAARRDGWLHAEGWRPLAHTIDAARVNALTRECPLAMEALDGHAVWANAAALHAAGISRDTPDPPGGVIDRDASGAPTGVLRETAVHLLARAEPSPSAAAVEAQLRVAHSALLTYGVTRAHVMEGRATYEALSTLDRAGEWRIDTDMFVPVDVLDDTLAAVAEDTHLPHVRVRGVKVFLDGSLGSHTAAFRRAYKDAPHDCGVLRTDAAALRDHLLDARRRSLDAAVHGIGDRAIGVLCDALESLAPQERPAHVRVEHAQHVAPEDVPRLRALGLTASMQPLHAPLDAPLVERVLGDDMLLTHAWATLARAGIPLVFGSDAPVATPRATHAVATACDAASGERIGEADALSAHGVRALRPGDAAHVVVRAGDDVLCTIVGDDVLYEAGR